MKRLAWLLLLLSCGCSTRPLAGFLDFAFPPRKIPPGTPSFGGMYDQLAPPPNAILQPLPIPETTELPGLPVPPIPPP